MAAALDHVENKFPVEQGFKSGESGTHTSRTIMLEDLRILLSEVPANATKEDYWRAIIEENVLGKKTLATKRLSAQRLSELYGLDKSVIIFRLLRTFWEFDGKGRPLLAMLCACARDPLLRMSASTVLGAKQGEIVTTTQIEKAVTYATPGRFNAGTLNKIARNSASSWTQSGHLNGRNVKKRVRPVLTIANLAYALALGHVTGQRGSLLFHTFWVSLLDSPEPLLHDLARSAGNFGWLTYRGIGNIIEVEFSPTLIG